ncbi:Sesquipedalian-1 [Pseudolycoriella hygida]|uniref:Sesquipedalian-1 n=1 Tax=Pseudolycoriella hygida TaxID=35572 RepID=A0A9Q0RZE7_9DIPT|nr:Sesquipedalian-1 [Pseudolycoriella hygida]
MKINEKNLCMFATCPPVDLEGWLAKRGEVNKNYQRRYFVLKGNLLFYFEKKGDREPLGVIVLEGCTIELAKDEEQYCFQVVFHGINNRTYYLSAESQDLMETWMKALTCAGYEYMKLMVSELQRQLDEIEGTKDATSNKLVTPQPPPRRHNPFNRTAPPPPTNVAPFNAEKVITSSDGAVTLNSTTNNNQKSASTVEDFSFIQLHEAFQREILKDLIGRRKLNSVADEPLIVL